MKNSLQCSYCENLSIERNEGSKLIQHMATHILHDLSTKGLVNACGLCLSTSQVCTVYLKRPKGAGRAFAIDTDKSRCPNLCLIKLGAAGKSSKANPCTNIPLICPLCPNKSPAVWKYNLQSHIRSLHPDCNIQDFSSLYTISEDEKSSLKRIYEAAQKSRRGKRKREDERLSVLSEAHCV